MIVLYRIYQLFVMAPLLIVATVLAALVTIIGCMLGGGRWWGYYPAHWWGRLFCILSLVRVTVRGRENIDTHTSYVFVANHQGAYDIFSIYGYLGHRFRWMMKASLRNIPLVGLACEKSHQIYVDKSSPTALRHTMERAEAVLRAGTSLVVFPEGARTWNGRMRPFKRGAFMLANEFGLPLVPVTIDGAFDVMPRTAKIPRWGHITLTIHRPIPAPPTPKEQAEVIEKCFEAVNSSLPIRHRSLTDKPLIVTAGGVTVTITNKDVEPSLLDSEVVRRLEKGYGIEIGPFLNGVAEVCWKLKPYRYSEVGYGVPDWQRDCIAYAMIDESGKIIEKFQYTDYDGLRKLRSKAEQFVADTKS